MATLSNTSYNITALTVQSSVANGTTVTTVVFIVDFQQNVSLTENATAVEEERPDGVITYTFGQLVGVTPSSECTCALIPLASICIDETMFVVITTYTPFYLCLTPCLT